MTGWDLGREDPSSNVQHDPSQPPGGFNFDFFFFFFLLVSSQGLWSTLFSTTRADSSSRPRLSAPGARRSRRLAEAAFIIYQAPSRGWLCEGEGGGGITGRLVEGSADPRTGRSVPRLQSETASLVHRSARLPRPLDCPAPPPAPPLFRIAGRWRLALCPLNPTWHPVRAGGGKSGDHPTPRLQPG